MQDILELIVLIFSPAAKCIVLQGSHAWDGNRRNSDLDIEIILENINLLKKFINKNLPENLKEEIILYEKKLSKIIDALSLSIFSIKFTYDNQRVSLRFTNFDLFKEICEIPLEKARSTKSVFQCRTHPTKCFDIQRNFMGEMIKYERFNFINQYCQLIESSIFIIDCNDRFYPGSITDRYLSFPKLLYDEDNVCQIMLAKLKENLVKRFIFEDNIFGDKNANISLCFSRRDQIPTRMLDTFNKECEEIKLQLMKTDK